MKKGFSTHLKAMIIKRAHETGDLVTQKKIAETTGISQPTLSRWYQGKIDRLDFDTVEKLVRYFGCEFSELVTFELSSEEHSESRGSRERQPEI